MLMKDDEAKRNTAWRAVMTVTSVLIIIIAAFFLTRLFTANPLEGSWSDTENGMTLKIEKNGVMKIEQALDEATVSVPVEYTIDKDTKRFAVHIKEEKLEEAAAKTDNLTVQDLQDIADVMEGTYEYSIDEQVLTLTEMEYGTQKTFVRE